MFAKIKQGMAKWLETYQKKSVSQIVRPVGVSFTPKIPTGQEVAFWKTLPIQGIERLTLPNGTTLTLSIPQGKAAKGVVHSMATGVWTAKTKSLLDRLIAGLKWPRKQVIRALEATAGSAVAGWMRRNPAISNVGMGVAEYLNVPLIGTGLGGWTAGMDIAARGLSGVGNVVRRLMSDTSGGSLRSILTGSKIGVPQALKRAADAAAAGNQELYRTIMWGALQQQDVHEFLQQEVGSSGVNAPTPRVPNGYQGA